MKHFVKSLFHSLGLDLTRYKKSPYERLLRYPRYTELTLSLLGKPFKVADSTSFYYSYREIFLDQIYRFGATTSAPLIVDCGANLGLSVVYFKNLYPNAKIIAVEADPEIFEILKWNMGQREFDALTLIQKAVSEESSAVPFYHEGADAGRVHTLANSKNVCMVDTLDLDTLLDTPVDFLKVDIEGSETAVLCASKNLVNVSQAFIEYHSFGDDRQNLELLLQKLSSAGFRYYIHTQFCSPSPLIERKLYLGMDMQLNIFACRDK